MTDLRISAQNAADWLENKNLAMEKYGWLVLIDRAPLMHLAANLRAALEAERHRSRWNIDQDGEDLLVCFGDHDKGEKCDFVRFVRAALIEAHAKGGDASDRRSSPDNLGVDHREGQPQHHDKAPGAQAVTGGAILPPEPSEEAIYAAREAWRGVKMSAVCGMTVEAQFKAEFAREIAALRAAYAIDSAKSQWRPIESAPKDGTEIIVWLASDFRTAMVVSYDRERPGDPKYPWRTLAGIGYAESLPTHWMPLPATPSEDEK